MKAILIPIRYKYINKWLHELTLNEKLATEIILKKYLNIPKF
jgi:hypothetical protein